MRRFQDTHGAGRKLTLLYLFWEPTNAALFEVFRKHRSEIDSFAGAVEGSSISFAWMTYLDLWREWDEVVALRQHSANLCARYRIAV